MGDDGPSYVHTWDTNPSQISATSHQTQTPLHTLTTKTLNTQHKKAYKMTNQKTRTIHKPYPNTSYTRNIHQNTTN